MVVNVYERIIGQHLDAHDEFKTRLAGRLHVRMESLALCDVILALCTITSRVGTDVEAAVKEIPDGKPVILVVFHHTFDEDYVVPDSRRFINRQNVLLVNILFHESQGVLRCQQNDEALKKVSDYLIDHGAEYHSPHRQGMQTRPGRSWWCIALAVFAIVCVIIVVIVLIEYARGDLSIGTSNNHTDQHAVHGGP